MFHNRKIYRTLNFCIKNQPCTSIGLFFYYFKDTVLSNCNKDYKTFIFLLRLGKTEVIYNKLIEYFLSSWRITTKDFSLFLIFVFLKIIVFFSEPYGINCYPCSQCMVKTRMLNSSCSHRFADRYQLGFHTKSPFVLNKSIGQNMSLHQELINEA